MKTTLEIPDPVYRRLKQHAATSRRTVSSLVAELLDAGLRTASSAQPVSALPPLPAFAMGPTRVDVADRDALYRAMDDRSNSGHVSG